MWVPNLVRRVLTRGADGAGSPGPPQPPLAEGNLMLHGIAPTGTAPRRDLSSSLVTTFSVLGDYESQASDWSAWPDAS